MVAVPIYIYLYLYILYLLFIIFTVPIYIYLFYLLIYLFRRGKPFYRPACYLQPPYLRQRHRQALRTLDLREHYRHATDFVLPDRGCGRQDAYTLARRSLDPDGRPAFISEPALRKDFYSLNPEVELLRFSEIITILWTSLSTSSAIFSISLDIAEVASIFFATSSEAADCWSTAVAIWVI